MHAFLAESAIELAELNASPKQLAFQKLFFDRQDDDGRALNVFAGVGGNRSGKTFVCGWMCFAKYLRDYARNGDAFWAIAPNYEKSIGAAGGQQRDLWQALPRWMFGEQSWNEKGGFTHRKIVLPTRDGGTCVVEFRSSDQDATTFESGKLSGVWADESLPEQIFDRIIPRVVDRNGFILYSDIPEQWWQFERLKEAHASAGVHFQHFTMHDNAHNLPPGAIERAEAMMTEDEKALRIRGEFVVMEGVVYREYVDKLKEEGGTGGHLCKSFAVPSQWPRWRVIDYGGSAPTACAWIAIGPNEDAYVYREHYERGHNVQKNAAMIIDASGDEQYVQTFMDPHAVDRPPAYYGSSPSVEQQYRAAGIASTGWPFVNIMGEHALVQKVKLRLEKRKLFIFDNCMNLRREFRSWKYELDPEGKPKAKDSFENTNNHLLDCLKGFFATNPSYQPGRIEIVGKERAGTVEGKRKIIKL